MKFITSTREYREIYLDHCRKQGRLFTFLIRSIPDKTFAAGIIVSKRVGNAVIRNKVKRRVRACLRENGSAYPVGEHIIIIAKPEAGIASWADIKNDLQHILKQEVHENIE
ncbi:MAG TPA: ribonuclease P protein component [Candidatus Cloacimonadota bacterium]|nr:ribonuclease P protein component [Candidatus Cloacimonadota bacterium]